ncbi:APC family permease [Mycoplasmopsis felis]|uniref:APC family permease n=1 Tax=Mycoplasmopsis felis TaxID=33923 RepID=UPI002DD43D4E|nr:amino acid permease [Mycoplasmopsis felis]WRX06585.1 amino acid permease [Mycoplasmopsis felis]
MNKNKKIGFFLSLMMLIGSVVGIGIFFKNGGISRAVNGDGLSWLLAWIIGGIISITAALSFAEIGSFKNTKLTGLSNWAYKVGRARFGYFTATSYTLFYWGILATVLGLFFSEIFFQFLSTITTLNFKNIPIYVHIIVGFVIMLMFIVLNYLSTVVSGYLQSIVTIIKFIPLVFALFIGILFPNTHNSDGMNAFLKNSFTIKGIIAALPFVLFSYDAFLVSGSLSHKTKNPSKTLPKVILVGLVFVTILYTLIALSSIFHNAGFIGTLIADSISVSAAKYVTPIIFFFLIISTLGVINGISSGFTNEIRNLINSNLLFGSTKLKNKFGYTKTTFIYMGIIMTLWSLIIFIPSIVLNSDILIDGISNFTTVFFFSIYAIVILLYTIKRNKFSETTKMNKYLYYITAITTVIGITIIEIAFIVINIEFLTDLSKTNPAGWGLFLDNQSNKIPAYLPILLYVIFLFTFISLPFINYYLELKINKRNLIKSFNELVMLKQQD